MSWLVSMPGRGSDTLVAMPTNESSGQCQIDLRCYREGVAAPHHRPEGRRGQHRHQGAHATACGLELAADASEARALRWGEHDAKHGGGVRARSIELAGPGAGPGDGFAANRSQVAEHCAAAPAEVVPRANDTADQPGHHSEHRLHLAAPVAVRQGRSRRAVDSEYSSEAGIGAHCVGAFVAAHGLTEAAHEAAGGDDGASASSMMLLER